jgi:apolipoprotein N-acyltransferase
VVEEQAGQIPELPAGHWQDFKKVAGVVTATIPIDSRVSLYSHLGDWLPWLCWAVIAGGIVVAIRRRKFMAAT